MEPHDASRPEARSLGHLSPDAISRPCSRAMGHRFLRRRGADASRNDPLRRAGRVRGPQDARSRLMRVMVLHAQPVETSFSRALCNGVVESLRSRGHEVDVADLYAENFDPVLTREGRLAYHDTAHNITAETKPYVD